MQLLKAKIKLFFIAVFLTAIFGCEKGKDTVAHQLPEAPETVPVEEPPVEAGNAPAQRDWERPTHFIPLADNERFAYSVRQVENEDGTPRKDMTVYAVRNNDTGDTREVFSWKHVDILTGDNFQFTDDLKTFFFKETRNVARYFHRSDLYMADGRTGKVRKLLPDILFGFRLSHDGRYIAFVNLYREFDPENAVVIREYEKANIFLFDIENEIMHQFEWQMKSPINGGWTLRRAGNVFKIYADAEEDLTVVGEAELNPETLELTILWDKSYLDLVYGTQPEETRQLQTLYESPYWKDGVYDIANNPNIRISPNPGDYNPNKE